MIIKSIKLENIRSYVNEEISFPDGSLLLSGDIGSGKSTILLAVDFALFGITKNINGASLLRNGANFGAVELAFTVDDKDFVIRRTLKRASNSVIQDYGFILKDDVKREATHVEIKQFVLELLNYPKELLTKSKSLVYRYTVYTPQEEMKTILLGEEELRLDTLRKVFGVDKYKRIKENCKIFITQLREKMREYAGNIADLDDKLAEIIEQKNKLTDINNKIKLLEEPLKKVNDEFNTKKQLQTEIQNKINKFNETKNKISLLDLDYKNNLDKKKELEKNLLELEKQINELKIKIKITININEINYILSDKELELKKLDNEIKEIHGELRELRYKDKATKEIKDSIAKLDICPTCKQLVTQDYKFKVVEKADSSIEDINNNISTLNSKHKALDTNYNKLKEDIELLKKQLTEFELNELMKKNIEEKTKIREEFLIFKEDIQISLEKIQDEKTILLDEVDNYKNIEQESQHVREELDYLIEKRHEIELEVNSLETEANNMKNLIEILNSDIKYKKQIKNKLIYLTQIQYWLEEFFINIIDNMERTIMMKVHYDFDILFRKWFDILINDENIKVRLNDDFAPSIEQNNHDIAYEFLSGGEKTAAALAYRLALNQVINNLLSTIKTNDLIILDEPTDGFSDTQIDRIRLVLDELNIKQVIIVSHEPKIESFVDNIIRLEKNNHISRIIQ